MYICMYVCMCACYLYVYVYVCLYVSVSENGVYHGIARRSFCFSGYIHRRTSPIPWVKNPRFRHSRSLGLPGSGVFEPYFTPVKFMS